ncbi:hypothetical protein FRC06_001243, partial [Ceratobasidium sp. 370]
PGIFANLGESLPPDHSAYELQANKARQAAADLLKGFPDVKEAVQLLETRKEEWESRLYQWWDVKEKAYVTGLLEEDGKDNEEEDSDSEVEPESEDMDHD